MKPWILCLAIWGVFAVPALSQATFTLTSPAVAGKAEKGFDSGLVSAGRADPAYNGSVSLPFSWSGLPKGTKALALVYDDPDARLVMKAFGVSGEVWTHWVATDIDPAAGGLKADAAASGKLVLGKNTSGNAAYGGPAPPADVPADAARPIVHIYRLTVYALSAPTGLKAGFTVDDLKTAMADKTLGFGQLNLSWSN
jgi:Raf kinase inhibitor-like YbhB/YbcL family protein